MFGLDLVSVPRRGGGYLPARLVPPPEGEADHAGVTDRKLGVRGIADEPVRTDPGPRAPELAALLVEACRRCRAEWDELMGEYTAAADAESAALADFEAGRVDALEVDIAAWRTSFARGCLTTHDRYRASVVGRLMKLAVGASTAASWY